MKITYKSLKIKKKIFSNFGVVLNLKFFDTMPGSDTQLGDADLSSPRLESVLWVYRDGYFDRSCHYGR